MLVYCLFNPSPTKLKISLFGCRRIWDLTGNYATREIRNWQSRWILETETYIIRLSIRGDGGVWVVLSIGEVANLTKHPVRSGVERILAAG